MNKILSIGTIVKVRGMYDGVNLMIIGYFPIEKETEKIFDYSGILYPQGLVGERSYCFVPILEVKPRSLSM